MENYGLNSKIKGVDMMDYMTDLIARNESAQIEVERCKLSIGILKQMNNYSRLAVDVARLELRKKEYDDKHSVAIA